MKLTKTILAFLLAALMLASCGTDAPDPAESPASESETDAAVESGTDAADGNTVTFTPDLYPILRAEQAKKSDVNTAVALRKALKEAMGQDFTLKDDWFKKEEDISATEILIGEVDRPESREIYETLGEYEWCVAVKNGKLVLAGGTGRALTEALNYFVDNYVTGKSELKVPADLMHRETAPLFTIDWEADAEDLRVSAAVSYPRLYQLQDGTLLCGIDGYVYRSKDDGTTWSKATDYRAQAGYTTEDGKNVNLTVANSAFIQLEDGTILIAYRAIGWVDEAQTQFYTKIQVSCSTNNGVSWKFHSLVDEQMNTGKTGVWEPHFGYIDGVLTCFYANDSRVVTGSDYQHIEYKQWIDGEWTNRTIVANGIENKSREGMPVWQQLSNGAYVCAIEGWEPGGGRMCLKLVYSEDGKTWDKPVIVYRSPRGYAGAPYIVELPTGQVLITFQDKDYVCHSIISDGTPVKELTEENFTKPVNVFGTDGGAGHFSCWNGMFLNDKYLYVVTGTDQSPDGDGTLIKRVEIAKLWEKIGK